MAAVRSWVVRYGVKLALWVAMLLALVGSLYHVAWGFSTLSGGNVIMGYVQAVAVDIGLAGLAVGIQQKRSAGKSTLRLWGGVLMFALISTYANLLYGFAHRNDAALVGLPAWMLMLRPWVLSAALPSMVIYLSEIVSEPIENNVILQETVTTVLPVPKLNGRSVPVAVGEASNIN